MDMVARSRLVLLVDPDPAVLRNLEAALHGMATARACTDFKTARAVLTETVPDLLVTNLRLEAFNGLHLVYLARSLSPNTQCVVYDAELDIGLARMAQAVGAFYERPERLRSALLSYALVGLPAADRRDPAFVDRRQRPRGGRRAADVPLRLN